MNDQNLNQNEGKETAAGGGHVEVSPQQLSDAVKKQAPHPGGIEHAAGMQAGGAGSEGSEHTQPQMPDIPAGNTDSHRADG